MLGERLERWRKLQWTPKRAVTVMALVGVALLEMLYGCAGERAVESFVEENVGEVQEGITCDYINCVAPDPCHTPASSCNGGGMCSFVPVSDGTACATGKVCSSGSCISDCFIGNQLFSAGTVNPVDKCQVCTPATATTSWTAVANGTSCATGEVCSGGSCVPACFIGGTLYGPGTVAPGNVCQVCTPSSATTTWSNVADGTSCGSGTVCGGGSCLPDCYIGAALYTSGAANPNNACQVCTPSSSTSSWVDLPDGTSCGAGVICSAGGCVPQCYIGSTFYGAGITNPGNSCQVCTPASSVSGWSNTADGTSCGVGKVCGGGSCLPDCYIAGALYGTGITNPGNACQLCAPLNGTSAWSNKADGTICNGNEFCGGGTCLPDCFIAGTLYATGAPNPNNACQVCAPGTFPTAWASTATGTSCGAGLLCAGGSCTSACYIGGTLYSAGTVNPNNACQACTPGTSTAAWSNKADGTSCNDNNACTNPDTCQSGVCKGTAVVCTALDACHTAGTCAPGTGVCSNPTQADGTSCGAGQVCTAGNCAGINKCGGVTCSALDQCHLVGTCAPATGVCTNPNKPDGTACNDNNSATVNDACTGGVCAGIDLCTGVTCPAPDQCHAAGTCAPATGVCSNPALADGTACNDNNPCTTHDTCQSGACNGGAPVVCAPLDQCHDAGVCDSVTGMCSNPNKVDGSGCDDGNTATVNDVCKGGLCAGVDQCAGVTCKASDACHVTGTCAPATGVCSDPKASDGTACTSGAAGTTGACTGGVCVGLCATVTCAAIDQCHAAGTCDASTGKCTNPNKPDGASCDDGNPNTAGDVCTGGVCGPPNPCSGVTCAAADDCHEPGTCEAATGKCTNPVKSDGAACAGGVCKGGACATDPCAAVTCSASDACHAAGTCDSSTGKCTNPSKPDGSACSGGTCESGTCSTATNYYACAAARPEGAPAVAGLLGAALALAAARRRRSRRRGL